MTNYILPTNYNSNMENELNLSLTDLESVKNSKRNKIDNNAQRIANYVYDSLKDIIDDYNLEGLVDYPYNKIIIDDYNLEGLIDYPYNESDDNDIHLLDRSFDVKPEMEGNDIKFARILFHIDSLKSFQIYMRYSYDLRANAKCKTMKYIPSEKRSKDDISFFSEVILDFRFGFLSNWKIIQKDKNGKLEYNVDDLNGNINDLVEKIKTGNDKFIRPIATLIQLLKTDKIKKLYKKLYDDQYNFLHNREMEELNSIINQEEKISNVSKLILEDGSN